MTFKLSRRCGQLSLEDHCDVFCTVDHNKERCNTPAACGTADSVTHKRSAPHLSAPARQQQREDSWFHRCRRSKKAIAIFNVRRVSTTVHPCTTHKYAAASELALETPCQSRTLGLSHRGRTSLNIARQAAQTEQKQPLHTQIPREPHEAYLRGVIRRCQPSAVPPRLPRTVGSVRSASCLLSRLHVDASCFSKPTHSYARVQLLDR